MSPAALAQRRQRAKLTPAQVRRVLKLAGVQDPTTGRWEMSVRAIGALVGVSGARVHRILTEAAKATAA